MRYLEQLLVHLLRQEIRLELHVLDLLIRLLLLFDFDVLPN